MLYALIERDLHFVVFNLCERARNPCSAVIGPLTQAVLNSFPTSRMHVENDGDAEIIMREVEIEKWLDLDPRALIFIINHLIDSQCAQIARACCTHAYGTWNTLNSFYGERCEHCGAASHESEHCHQRQ